MKVPLSKSSNTQSDRISGVLAGGSVWAARRYVSASARTEIARRDFVLLEEESNFQDNMTI